MEYNKINGEILSAIKSVVGDDAVFTDHLELEKYNHDETEDLIYFPEVVVKPTSPEEVSGIMKACNQYNIPVTPRGAGTGLSGGALPVRGGVLMSMERFNRVLESDELNLQATVE